ncbi:MAG: hypothetical protein FVQ80_13665 [Planctomycetes bacterium]|nr:hypothetical protein [Planctomycetota bacterium]
MKIRKSILDGALMMAAALIVSCATKPYMAKEDEEIFAAWVNTSYNSIARGKDDSYIMAGYAQKIITKPDGTYELYGSVTDMVHQLTFKYTIIDKWTDSDGNIWYKIIAKYKTEYMEQTRYGLDKISNSGRTWEYVGSANDYPTKIGPNHPEYRIYYRQEE